MKKLRKLLFEIDACHEAIGWATGKTIEEAVNYCHRGDWLLWLAREIEVELEPFILAKAICAKTVIHLMTDERSRRAVEVAEAFGLGKATFDELETAAENAAKAEKEMSAVPYGEYNEYAAAQAATTCAQFYSTATASFVSDTYRSGNRKNLLETVHIFKTVLGERIIKKVNELLNQ